MSEKSPIDQSGWTIADAKARLSEVLRLATEEPQYIGTNRAHVVVSAEQWHGCQPKPAMGSWLVNALHNSTELQLPARCDPPREIPFDD